MQPSDPSNPVSGSASSPSLEQLQQWDSQHYWHAFTQMAEYEPLIVDRAEGVWLYDHLGRRLLDGVSSLWCNLHGHRHPRIDAAIRQQLDQVSHVTSLGMSNSTTIRLCQELVSITPDILQCVFLSSDGSSAIEVALKMAFQYWRQVTDPQPQRDLFLALGSAYHGDTLGSVSVGGVSRFHAMFDPLLFDVVRGPCPDSYRTPNDYRENGTDLAEHYLEKYRKILEQFGERVAAIIVEPLVQGAAGMVMHPPGFLRGMRELADEYGTLLIADEIAVGMGRTGTMWACEQELVQPDILCAGKGLSGGYLPLAATLTTRDIWNAFLGTYAESKSLFHGHSFGGNPLACAAALATLQVFEEEDTLAQVRRHGDWLQRRLEPLKDHPVVGDIRCKGMIAAVEVVRDRETKQGFAWSDRKGYHVCEAALEKGVWLRPIANSIIIMPPLCSSADHLDQIVEAIEYGLDRVGADPI